MSDHNEEVAKIISFESYNERRKVALECMALLEKFLENHEQLHQRYHHTIERPSG